MAHSCKGGCRAQKFISLHKSGMADCESGDLDAALLKLQMALQEVRKIGLEGYQVKVLNNLGIVFETMGEKEEARHHYQAALWIARKKLGPRAKLFHVVDNNLARVS
jgi:tetratricopeptide (TPR) repeat protein